MTIYLNLLTIVLLSVCLTHVKSIEDYVQAQSGHGPIIIKNGGLGRLLGFGKSDVYVISGKGYGNPVIIKEGILGGTKTIIFGEKECGKECEKSEKNHEKDRDHEDEEDDENEKIKYKEQKKNKKNKKNKKKKSKKNKN